MSGEFDFWHSIVLTAGVFAALITSVANIVISIFNNSRLKTIEKNKQMTEIEKYRYSRLYELILNWSDYNSEWKGKTTQEIASERLMNAFLDDSRRYDISRPLLDNKYISELDKLQTNGENLLKQLLKVGRDQSKSEIYDQMYKQYIDNGYKFCILLKDTINQQLSDLLSKDNK